jgi:hypothetical protein
MVSLHVLSAGFRFRPSAANAGLRWETETKLVN